MQLGGGRVGQSRALRLIFEDANRVIKSHFIRGHADWSGKKAVPSRDAVSVPGQHLQRFIGLFRNRLLMAQIGQARETTQWQPRPPKVDSGLHRAPWIGGSLGRPMRSLTLVSTTRGDFTCCPSNTSFDYIYEREQGSTGTARLRLAKSQRRGPAGGCNRTIKAAAGENGVAVIHQNGLE